MPIAPVTDWGEALMTSLATGLVILFAAIPKIIGFLIILIIGWLIASAIATAVTAVLRTVKFNDVAKRSGFSGFVEKMGIRKDASAFLADIIKWFVRLIVLVSAFDALGLPAVSQVLQQLLLWLPNLVVALVILVLAGLAANALSGLVRGATAEAGLGNPGLLATVAKVAVWGFAIVIAVNQIGVATTLVNTLFMGLVGALALALGLAFGLGGRDTAGQMVASWYRSGQQAAPKLERAADAAEKQTQAPAERTSGPSVGVRPGDTVVVEPRRS
ncbi:MAG: mechanosensitive ion channel family protein [Chloroflexota bacterium]